jgi:hypothetical protein
LRKHGFLEKTLEALQFLWGPVVILSFFTFVFFDPTDWAVWKKPWLVENLTNRCLDHRPVLLNVKLSHEASHLAETIKYHPLDTELVRKEIIWRNLTEGRYGFSERADNLWQILSAKEKERISEHYFELTAWNEFVRDLVPRDNSLRDVDWSQFEEGDKGLSPNDRYFEQLIEEVRQHSESSGDLKNKLDSASIWLEIVSEDKIDTETTIRERIEDNEKYIASARNKLFKKANEIEKANLATESWLSYSDKERRHKCGSIAASINQTIGPFDKIDTEISWEKMAVFSE